MKKAMRVLDLFSLERPEWGVSEVAKALGFPKSTTSELMSDLADQGLLSRSTKGKYRLGWRLFEFSQTLLDTTEFRIEARRVLKELVECWRETVHLAVLYGVQAVYLEKLQPTPAVKIWNSRTGARLPALLIRQHVEELAEPGEAVGQPEVHFFRRLLGVELRLARPFGACRIHKTAEPDKPVQIPLHLLVDSSLRMAKAVRTQVLSMPRRSMSVSRARELSKGNSLMMAFSSLL